MTYRIINIMNLIEYDPLNILKISRVIVKHLLQNLSSHNDACCICVQGNISSADTNYIRLILMYLTISELIFELSVLLIRQSLNWRSVDSFGHVLPRNGDSILRDNSFTS